MNRNFGIALMAAFGASFATPGCQREAPVTPTATLTSTSSSENAPAASDARAVAKDAYLFGYPLVLMDVSREKGVNVANPTTSGAAPTNQFSHMARFPDATFVEVGPGRVLHNMLGRRWVAPRRACTDSGDLPPATHFTSLVAALCA